jgi:hypothetical protein
MTAAAPEPDLASPDTDHAIDATACLLHRRRGWGWTCGGSLIALIVFIAIGVNVWPNATGSTAAICGFIVLGLLALAAASLIVVIVDTVRLHHRHPSVRTAAVRRTSHHPVYAHPFRTPHHRVSHVFAWVLIVLWIGLSVGFLPDQVNAIAYAVGAGNTVTFFPESYSQVCSRGGCYNETLGFLGTTPPVDATWQNQVPLDHPFEVRQPVWDAWGSPDLMDGPSAAGVIAGGVFFDFLAVLAIIELVLIVRRWMRRRRSTVPLVTSTG